MLSPARRLLPDILQEIFVRCLPTGGYSAMSRMDAPLVLGRVCREWRDIAYSTPSLWSAIHIAIPKDSSYVLMHTCSHATRMRAIQDWLSRSGICPLYISISTPCSPSPRGRARESTIGRYLDAVLTFLPRCKSFHFSSRYSSWDFLIPKLPVFEIHGLKYLHLDVGAASWENEKLTSS
jgi:hypothetical protein